LTPDGSRGAPSAKRPGMGVGAVAEDFLEDVFVRFVNGRLADSVRAFFAAHWVMVAVLRAGAGT